VLRATGEVEQVFRIRAGDDRLQGHERHCVQRPPAGLFLNLACRGHHRIFVGVDVTARQLPHPTIDDEAMAPHHQHAVFIV
jgi:hypothetical protein